MQLTATKSRRDSLINILKWVFSIRSDSLFIAKARIDNKNWSPRPDCHLCTLRQPIRFLTNYLTEQFTINSRIHLLPRVRWRTFFIDMCAFALLLFSWDLKLTFDLLFFYFFWKFFSFTSTMESTAIRILSHSSFK